MKELGYIPMRNEGGEWCAVFTTTSTWPEGIDYEKWSKVVRPSPREAFADPLDFLDVLDDPC